MTDPTESPESLALDEIRKRHRPRHGEVAVDVIPGYECFWCGEPWPCDAAVALAAHDERARAFTALADVL